MPTYEYVCLKCKKRFEKLQKMSDAPLKKCESCGGKAERQIGAGAGLIFMGTGFYITDYKKPAKGGDKGKS
jgi:putative FmdB family regulatory protein